MQSLILATSLVLSGPAPISTLDNSEVLEELVNSQTASVARVISHQAKAATQDTFLYQAKLAIQSSTEFAFVAPETAEVEAD